MIVFYLLVLTFITLVLVGGFDATLRLIAYVDLLYRYQIVKVKMWVMRKKLESQLAIDHKKLVKELEKKE